MKNKIKKEKTSKYKIKPEVPYSGMGGPNLYQVWEKDICVEGNLYYEDAVKWVKDNS